MQWRRVWKKRKGGVEKGRGMNEMEEGVEKEKG